MMPDPAKPLTPAALTQKIQSTPHNIQFADVMATIEAYYRYTPTAFRNGDAENAAGSNAGSCKIFAFAQQQNLTQALTLHCFGDYYRKDVLENPTGKDHANIRNFMQSGWQGLHFDSEPLMPLNS